MEESATLVRGKALAWLAGFCKWDAKRPVVFPGRYESKLEVFADASLNGEKTQGMDIKFGGGKSRQAKLCSCSVGLSLGFPRKLKLS